MYAIVCDCVCARERPAAPPGPARGRGRAVRRAVRRVPRPLFESSLPSPVPGLRTPAPLHVRAYFTGLRLRDRWTGAVCEAVLELKIDPTQMARRPIDHYVS